MPPHNPYTKLAKPAAFADRPTQGFHYDLVGEALRILEEREGNPPSLDELAERIGMSPSHFQKLFSKMVGVSPARYMQYLRLDHARYLLRNRHTILDASYETGFSSPGRLHDLFVRWEAMSPGEYAKGGADLEINYGFFPSPFGEVLAMATDRGICGLAFSAETGREVAFADMAARWPNATFIQASEQIAPWVDASFGKGGEAKLHLIGTPLQIKVWEALLAIPSGYVTTYGDIAQAIDNPRAVRAVGTAVGRNPISWLVPCHRALRKSGELGGYHWGLPVKRAMLAWETASLEQKEQDGEIGADQSMLL